MLSAMIKNVVLAPLLVYTLDARARADAVQSIQDFLGDGMQHRIAAVLALQQTVEAHEQQERGGVGGKLLLAPGVEPTPVQNEDWSDRTFSERASKPG
jgi:hypothetical protein